MKALDNRFYVRLMQLKIGLLKSVSKDLSPRSENFITSRIFKVEA